MRQSKDRGPPPLPVGTPIEVRAEKVSQLFNTLDPFPFNERDLDKDAEDYIVGCLRGSSRAQLGGTAFGRIVEESLIIVGWVANWKPIQIFLYDWWPVVRRRNLYRRLNAAKIEIQPY